MPFGRPPAMTTSRSARSTRGRTPVLGRRTRVCALVVSLLLTPGLDLAGPLPSGPAETRPGRDPVLKGLPITDLSTGEAILHALNRLAYGPRPGEVERVRQLGLAKWIEQQLNPRSINDKAIEARLQGYPTLRMSTAKLIDEYPQPKQQEKQAEKRALLQAQAQQE